MCRKWFCTLFTIANRHQQYRALIFRKMKGFFKFSVSEKVDPCCINSEFSSLKHNMGRDDTYIFNAGVYTLFFRILPLLINIVGKK